MAILPGISVKTISDSVSKTKSVAAETGKTIIKISKFLNKNISDKRNISSDIKSLKNKRIQREKRNILIDRMSAPILAVKPRGARVLSSLDSGTSIINRLLGFVGYLTAGWALSNLPTWIGLGEQFVARISTAGSILSNYGDELMKVMTDIGDVFMAAMQNISRFDFSDSSFLIRSSLEELKLSIDSLGDGINQAFQVLIQPFKALEKIPDAYNQLPSILPGFEPSEPSSSGTPGTSGRLQPIHKQALDIISRPESGGDYNAMNNGTAGDRPGGSKKWLGKNLTDMTIGEVKDFQNNKKTLWAAGRYQIVPGSLPTAQSAAGLKDSDRFDRNNQDLLAIGLLKTQGPGAWTKYSSYTKAEISIMYKAKDTPLGPQSAKITPSPSNSLLNLGSPAAAIASLFTGQKPTAIPAGQRRLQKGDVFTKSLGKGVDYIQITSLIGDGRGHGGIDIAAPSGTYISLRVDCEVVAQGRYGNYGLLIDVWIPSLGIQLRMAHLSSVIIKNGRIPAGTSFARVGTSGRVSGPHIHLEYDTKKGTRGGGAINDDPNYAANLDQYVRLLYLTNKPIGRAFSGTTPLVPGTPSVSAQPAPEIDIQSSFVLEALLGGLSQEREGRKVVVVDDRQPSNTMMISSRDSNIITDTTIDESSLLNSLIKNRFLLDLSYV